MHRQPVTKNGLPLSLLSRRGESEASEPAYSRSAAEAARRREAATQPSSLLTESTTMNCCGIDVSAQELVVALRVGVHDLAQESFPNTAAGHRRLLAWL